MTGADRVALVTGAGRGIGAAIARRLAADGCAVVAVDRCRDDPAVGYPLATRADLDAVVEGCGPRAVAVETDVRDGDALDAAVAVAVSEFGGLDIAVAAAGVIVGGDTAWDTSDAAWDANLEVNLTGVWRTARATVPAILRRSEPRSGRFVAIASSAGLRPQRLIGAYDAAKHGVVGLVGAMAVELGGSGVTANCVCPGSTDTAILEASARIYGLDDVAAFAVHHPLGRLLRPSEIASAVGWLCAEEQSGVTGISLPVDGGMTV